jgi:hypothetical protein
LCNNNLNAASTDGWDDRLIVHMFS